MKVLASPVVRKNLGAAAGLLAVFVLFTALLAATRGLGFADPDNLETILRQTTIVALARKLLVALWKYVTTGVVIEDATMKAA